MIGTANAILDGAPAACVDRLLAHGMYTQPAFREPAFRAHSPLSTDVTKLIDETVLHEFKSRLNITRRLLENGQVMRLPRPLGWTTVQHHIEDDETGAVVDRNILMRGEFTLPTRDPVLTPIFFIFADFQLSIQELMASQNAGQDVPLDTNLIRKKARNVAEKVEEVVVKGTNDGAALPQIGANVAKGLLNAPSIQTVSLDSSQAWNHASKTIVSILKDIEGIIVKFDTIKAFGPIDIAIPLSWKTALATRVNSNTDRTPLQVINESLAQMESRPVKIIDADTLPTDTAVAYLRSAVAVDLIVGDFGGPFAQDDPNSPDQNPVPITVLPWDERGGLMKNYKILTCVVPRPKKTFSGKVAIVKLS